ncbi:hypothetical protein E2C01_097400 [Portunus trituberculatus]|uniref:Uncharacterized protein n=1 Tax=Portunus trituberculatus TaxID=210409 RepID=A0A5B7KB60_PORTR|nr:hypothetical protein [Portunus trituberculatus]
MSPCGGMTRQLTPFRIDCGTCSGLSAKYPKVGRQEFCIGESLEPREATQSSKTTAKPTLREGGRGHTKHNLPMLLLVFFLHGYTRQGRGLGRAAFFFLLLLSFFFSSFCFCF